MTDIEEIIQRHQDHKRILANREEAAMTTTPTITGSDGYDWTGIESYDYHIKKATAWLVQAFEDSADGIHDQCIAIGQLHASIATALATARLARATEQQDGDGGGTHAMGG